MPAAPVSPIRAVVDHLEGVPGGPPGTDVDASVVAVSLLEALSTVPDPRSARGVRHGVLTVLVIAACAVVSGARSFTAIAEHARDSGSVVLSALGVGTVVPHESTLRRVLQSVDATALEGALRSWVRARLAEHHPEAGTPRREQRRVFALDGKTVRGARRASGGQAHLVAVLDQRSATVLAQTEVPAKTGEIAAVATVLDPLDLRGVLVTMDALHTQRAHACYLRARGGHYLMTVKGNQPTVLQELRALPWSQTPVSARQRCRGHGRAETRTIQVLTIATTNPARELFPHATQAIKIVRRRRSLNSTKWTTETVHAITSLTAFDADPTLLARWVRGHWGIENQLHWVRDVTFDEDRSQNRTGHGPHVMASLRNLAISALRLAGVTNIAAGLRHHARDATRPLQTYAIT